MAVNFDINILIVDDYKTMLRVIRNMLGQLGFKNVDEASDGQKALELMKQKKYNLILSDWNMEPMSGLDFLKAVRTNVDTLYFSVGAPWHWQCRFAQFSHRDGWRSRGQFHELWPETP